MSSALDLEMRGRALAEVSDSPLCDRGFDVEKAVKWALARVMARGLRVKRITLAPGDFDALVAEFERRGQRTETDSVSIATAAGRRSVFMSISLKPGEFDIRCELEIPGAKTQEAQDE